MQSFHQIRRLPPYVFDGLNQTCARLRAQGEDVIDLGMGNPDLPTPRHIVERLAEVVWDPATHRYSTSRGIERLRQAQAQYYERRFGVRLDPATQVLATLGSKEGFASLARAITAPGDVVLVPDPSYPLHAFAFLMAGATVRPVSAEPGPAFFHAMESAMRYSSPRPTVVVLCFPSNPTGVCATLDFYRDVVRFARKHGLMVLSDLAYAEIYFSDEPTPSLLAVAGASDIAVEFTSLSKTFSMAGWRIGFAVGNERLIAALSRLKSYLDYGAFAAVQEAAIVALQTAAECSRDIRAVYHERMSAATTAFNDAGWHVPRPDGGMFCWAPIPERFRWLRSKRFCEMVLEETGVALAPGVGFGEGGDDFVRVGLVQDPQRLREAATRIGAFLKRCETSYPSSFTVAETDLLCAVGF